MSATMPSPVGPGIVSVPLSAHFPTRPGWQCEVCAQPWPCPTRQAEFTTAIDAGVGQGVALLLASSLGRASLDRPDIGADRLHEQFLGWINADLYSRMIGGRPASRVSA
ncbi:hypothetical protein ACQP00_20335 [Dactylosporangium sp. CS-047395]|uniref:hypothetical protein n=1 Tax=Dactylosporangium sp. CS-047395 TaxID=3239936 RepID=UPI003D94250E